jgi:hypothetical protein
MTIIYRTDGDWGSGKGSNLTAAEVDENVYDLDARVTSLENDPPAAVDISNITQAGGVMTVHLNDGSSYNVDLPKATIKFRGDYTASTAYNVNDLVNAPGYGLYLVLIAHTAAATFDPDLSDTDGDYYQQVTPGALAPVAVTTTTYTLQLSDAGKYLRFTNAAGCTITVPDNDTVAFATGTSIKLGAHGAVGITLVEGATSVSITPPAGYDQATDIQHAQIVLDYLGSDAWDVCGLLAAVTA